MIKKNLVPLNQQEHTIVSSLFVMLAIAIPSSLFLTSLTSISLAIVFIFFRIKNKNLVIQLSQAFSSSIVLSISSLFFIYLFGLLYSTDLSRGINEVKIKLPLLFLPVIFHSYQSLNTPTNRNRLLLFFAYSTLTVSIINFCLYDLGTDIRSMSLFYSHIRFGICVSLSLLFLSHNFLNKRFNSFIKIGILISISWLFFYLYYSASYTAIFLLIIASLFYLFLCNKLSTKLKYALGLFILGLSFTIVYVGFQEFNYFKNRALKNDKHYEEKNSNGKPYEHKLDNFQVENGYYIWRNISYDELAYEWSLVSKKNFWKKDGENSYISANIIRYLTSKGLTKDSLGLSQLTASEIKEIEQGKTNYRFSSMNQIQIRIYETLWEIDYYLQGIAPINGSLVQRFAFWENAKQAYFSESLLIGSGTGDLKIVLEKQYQNSNLKEYPDFWKKPHNQYLTTLVQFGIIGLFVLIWCLLYPLLTKQTSLLHFITIVILIFSMFTEDTLDTQAGLSIFTFLHCLFSLK